MAGDKREVRVAVVGDAAQLQRELLKAEGKLNSFGSNAKSAGDTLRSALFGGAVLYGAKQLVDAAANLEQAIGGTAAVFGEASEPINKFVENAAELAGLSEETARSLTSQLGASLKGFGLSAEEAAKQSVFLTQTGADLAATLGGSSQEAVSALGSALRGEYDPLERFGIALKASEVNAKAVAMGLAESETDVSNYAKGQAALALITEKSAFAQNMFSKESDTASGKAAIAAAKTKDASADLGRSLLPIYTKINEVVAGVADAFSALPGPAQTGVIALTGVVLVGPKLVEGLTLATSAVRSAGTAMADMATRAVGTQAAIASMNVATQGAGTAATSAAGGFTMLNPILLAVAATAAVGALAWKSYSDEQAAVKKDIDALIPTFNELTGAMTDNTYETVANTLKSKNQIDNLNKAGISVRQFTDVLDDNRDALVKQGEVEAILRMRMEYGSAAVEDRIKAIREQGGTQNELIARLLETDAADMGLIETLYNGIDAYNQQQEVIRQLNIQKGIAEGKTEAQATAEVNLKEEVDKLNESLKKQYDAFNDLNDSMLTLEESEIKARSELAEYNKTLAKGSLTADERRQAEIDLEKAFTNTSLKAVEAAEAQAKLEGKTLTSAEAAGIQAGKYFELAETLAPDSPLRKRITDLGTQLYLLSLAKPVVTIDAETAEASRKIRELLNLTGELTGEYGQGLGFKKRATGGPVNSGTPYLVGEQGPELFVPSSYGRIMDAFSTNKALLSNAGGGVMSAGGSNVTINVTVAPTADKAAIGQTLVEAISAYERRSGDGWRS